MKRFWLGIGILAALLAVSIAVTAGMGKVHDDIAEDLESARAAAGADEWEKAAFLIRTAAEDWQKWRRLTASVADHEPMEEVDSLFAALEAYGSAREGPEFMAVCGQLAVLVRAIGEAHALTWWNLL